MTFSCDEGKYRFVVAAHEGAGTAVQPNFFSSSNRACSSLLSMSSMR